jgi:hypothetical protein
MLAGDRLCDNRLLGAATARLPSSGLDLAGPGTEATT